MPTRKSRRLNANRRSGGGRQAVRGTGEPRRDDILFKGWRSQQTASSFADRAVVSLDYAISGRQNPGVVALYDNVFSLTSVFDPEISGGGHQPREFDTWASIYGRYRVMRVLAEVMIRQRASHGISTVLVPSNSSSALVAADYVNELPRAVWGGVTGSNQPVVRMKVAFDPSAILGMTRQEYMADDTTSAAITTSPSQVVALHLVVYQVDGTTALDYEYEIRLRYEVEFYDRKTLSPSALIAENARLRAALACQADDDEEQVVVVRRRLGAAGAAAAAAAK